MKTEKITIFLDAGADLSMAGLPDSPQAIKKYERKYIRAAKKYGDNHDMIITVETDPTAPLPADFDEPRHTKIWQAIHNDMEE
jgi:hypothetical protein